jgi:hypothetical protein
MTGRRAYLRSLKPTWAPMRCSTVRGFAIPMKEAPETSTVIGLKGSKPIVVTTPYPEIVAWWLGKDAPPTPPAKAKAERQNASAAA